MNFIECYTPRHNLPPYIRNLTQKSAIEIPYWCNGMFLFVGTELQTLFSVISSYTYTNIHGLTTAMYYITL